MSRKEKYAKKSKKRLLPRILIGIVLIFFGGFIGSHFYFQNHFKFTANCQTKCNGLSKNTSYGVS